jgi:CelD/BcsL family acetyltransferase involved in cellulose biosynthesis
MSRGDAIMSVPTELSPPVRAASKRPVPAAPAPAPFSVLAIEDWDELEQYGAAWDQLAAAALEPNVFYESWMLLPALRAYGADRALTVVLVFANHQPRTQGQPLLCGLFPLERQSRLGGLVQVMSCWHYLHCFLGVPLVRAGMGRECLRALFAWLAADRRGGAVWECAEITGDGPFYHLLVEHLQEQQETAFVAACHTRALLRQDSGANPLQCVLSSDKRKKLRRAEERLAEMGPVQYVALADEGDVETWLADFLRLEASGWKGRAGTAFACNEADRAFFLSVARQAFARGQLMMLALHVGGRPIAQVLNFRAGAGAFAFKVAFDEEQARHSPGVLLEIENIRVMHATPALEWMDSCTQAGPTLTKQLWADRCWTQTFFVATGRAPGALFLAALPLLRWLRRRLRWRRENAPAGETS